MAATERPVLTGYGDVYVAGPLGFSESGRHFLESQVLRRLRELNIPYYEPFSAERSNESDGTPVPAGISPTGYAIGVANTRAIDRCRSLLAILDGADVDSGTAAEIGYAFAKGKRIIGYKGDFRQLVDVPGSRVNTQLEYFIVASGGSIVSTLDDAIAWLRIVP